MILNKSVVYTAIFGGYDRIADPVVSVDNMQYICFTDDETVKSDIWDIRIVKPQIPNDSCRSARYIKVHAHKFLSEFKYSMYIDGNMLLREVPDISAVLGEYKFAMGPHPGRDCVYNEARICSLLGKDDPRRIDVQIKAYEAIGFPRHSGLYASGLHFKMHNDTEVIRHCETWWDHIYRYSMRDQISFPVAFADYSIKHLTPELQSKCIIIRSLHPCLWEHHIG